MSKSSGSPGTRTEQGSSQGDDCDDIERDEVAGSAKTHVSARTLIKLEHSNLRSVRGGQPTGRRSSKGVGTDTSPDQDARDGSEAGVGRLPAKQYAERPSAFDFGVLKQYNLNVNINAVTKVISPQARDVAAVLSSGAAAQSIFDSQLPGA